MDQIIRGLIVDDELYSRVELKHLLESFPTVQVVGEAETGEAALVKALELQPDVVFLDVEMPKMNGMQTAQILMGLKKIPLIVFATAYPQFAAEAFRYEAVDYLLKPFDVTELEQTIQRIGKHFTEPIEYESAKPLAKLAVEGEGEIIYLDPAEILYMYRDAKITKILTKTKEYESKTALRDLESRLGPYSFFRIHKSYLVNLDYIIRLTPWFNGAYQLEIKGRPEMLAVSRNYVKALRSRLEL